MKKAIYIIIATVWISVSEFVRNELLFKDYWIEHYENLDMEFPSEPINGAIWGMWSFLFAIFIYIISKKFSTLNTIFVSWFAGFILMWVVLSNLNVLPYKLLWFAIPLSLLEVVIATIILKRVS